MSYVFLPNPRDLPATASLHNNIATFDMSKYQKHITLYSPGGRGYAIDG